VLAWLLRRPELIFRIDRLLQRYDLSPLEGEDFIGTDLQVVFDLVRQSVEQDEIDQHTLIVQSMPESLEGLKRELLSITENQHVLDDPLIEELLRGVRRVRGEAANEKRVQYRFLQLEAQEGGDKETASQYQEEELKLMQLKRALDEFELKMSLSQTP
jgi:hypothetical protein